MKNILKTTLIFIGSIYLIGCAAKQPIVGGVKDELYYLKNEPLIITPELVKEKEATVIQSKEFNAGVSDLSLEEQKTVNENLLVLFDFDSNKVNTVMHKTLDNQVEVLSSNPNLRVMLEGRTDERGTRTYNLVLGEQRVKKVKNYLINKGINPNQILTVSLGENEPLFLNFKDTQEKFWKLNRSVFFKFID